MSAQAQQSAWPPINTSRNLSAHIFSKKQKPTPIFETSDTKFQNPRTTLSMRKVTQGEREKTLLTVAT
jgi:hypothetical protein